MLKALSALAVLGIVVAATGAYLPQQAPSAVIPEEWMTKPNPVKPTAQSMARARQIYKIDCALCHGDDGSGKSDLAASMKLSLKDLRDVATLKDRKDGELYYMIEQGSGSMPPETGRAKPDELWTLVVYCRSFSDPSLLPSAAAEKSTKK